MGRTEWVELDALENGRGCGREERTTAGRMQPVADRSDTVAGGDYAGSGSTQRATIVRGNEKSAGDRAALSGTCSILFVC